MTKTKSLVTLVDEVDQVIDPNEKYFALEISKHKTQVFSGRYFDLIVRLEKVHGKEAIFESVSQYSLPVPDKISIITTKDIWQDRKTMELIRNSPYIIAYPTHKCKKIKRVK